MSEKLEDKLDSEGRPLGEHRASPDVRAGVPMVLKQCPYHDSRHEHALPMNTSALKQLTTHWDAALAGIAQVRAGVLARHPMSPVMTVGVLRISDAVMALSSYLTPLPAVVAAMYKIAFGISRVARVMLSGEMMAERSRPPKTADLWELVDLGGFLIGGEQVCAGSQRQIEQAIEVVIAGGQVVEELPLDAAFFTFADGLFRREAAAFLANAKATIDGTGDPAVTDPYGTVQQFVRTRRTKLHKLIAGWERLATE